VGVSANASIAAINDRKVLKGDSRNGGNNKFSASTMPRLGYFPFFPFPNTKSRLADSAREQSSALQFARMGQMDFQMAEVARPMVLK
jgi:hypothetical protein